MILILVLPSCHKEYDNTTIINGNWIPYEINGKSISNFDTFIVFNNDNTIEGNNSCNSFYGNYETGKDNEIKFSSIVTTKVGCINNTIEKEFMNVLSQTIKYNIVGDELVLYDDCNIIGKFKK